MQDLLKYLNSQGRIPELLAYIIQQGRFENLTGIGDIHKVDETYKAIIKGMLDAINAQLVIARVELRLINKQFVMAGVGDEVVIETPKVKIITSQYIRELPERIQDDIENKEYDSVITKSRTLLEEVLIFIIEKMTFERYKSNGDLVKIYQDATELLNMRQKGDWDKRVIGKTGSGLIVSALAFQGNPYDGHTLSAHSEQIARLTGYEPVEALTDRGYRGKKRGGNMAISIPSSGSPGQNYYQKRKARKKFCKRAGIEPVIGHLKSDHRMMRNYLKGTLGDAINTMMAAEAYNMRHWMNKHALSSFVSWLLTLVRRLENVLFENENQYAWKDSTLAMVAK